DLACHAPDRTLLPPHDHRHHPICATQTLIFSIFFFNDPATTEIYTLSLHDALPISEVNRCHRVEENAFGKLLALRVSRLCERNRSEEHTSELQSLAYLVCRLLLEKKNVMTGLFGSGMSKLYHRHGSSEARSLAFDAP